MHLIGFPSIRPVIRPAGLIGSGFLSQTDSGYGKGVGDLPCAATRSGFCCCCSSSSSSPSYIQPGFLSRTDSEPARASRHPSSVHPSSHPSKQNMHAEPSHWLHEIYISKTVRHHINWGYLFSIKDAIFTRVRSILKNVRVFTSVGAGSPGFLMCPQKNLYI